MIEAELTIAQSLFKSTKNMDSSAVLSDFAEAYDLHVKSVYDFIYYRTLHRQTAEDLTSQTFLKALENFQSYDSKKANIKTWLLRIARNTTFDHFRTVKQVVDTDDIWDLSDGRNSGQDMDANIQVQEIRKYLKGLSAEQREIIVLRVWEELSYQEIAQITEKSEASLKMAFSRAIGKLREQIPASILTLLLTLVSIYGQ